MCRPPACFCRGQVNRHHGIKDALFHAPIFWSSSALTTPSSEPKPTQVTWTARATWQSVRDRLPNSLRCHSGGLSENLKLIKLSKHLLGARRWAISERSEHRPFKAPNAQARRAQTIRIGGTRKQLLFGNQLIRCALKCVESLRLRN